ncbi:glycosyltransferase [Arenimonas caeni]|uniref:Glycosyl transferase n=1 Tax=Arenimonas caeni TaxID=2058085 RepID=A0A2P6MAG4_9GAMM|nr:glycosyltransferase [Arenimonas caeni]PRH82942.1 glycosyl transferase [Arenimonas caeni]
MKAELNQLAAEVVALRERMEQAAAALAGSRLELDAARQCARDLAEAVARVEDLQQQLDDKVFQLEMLQREAARLREDSQLLAMVRASRSWRLTRPLRALARLLRGEWNAEASAKLRAALRPGTPPAQAPAARPPVAVPASLPRQAPAPAGEEPVSAVPARMPAGPHLAAALAGVPDVFVWSVIDWHFRIQRPQHLARALSGRGHRVFYVSNHFVDSSEPGFTVEPLDGQGRLFQVRLHLAGAPAIYHALPDEAQLRALHESLARLLAWSGTAASLSLVQHPYWSGLVRSVPNARVVYDCMDHHAGFDNNAPGILRAEQALLADAELVVVTSAWLEKEVAPQARSVALVRNAGEFEFFREAPAKVFRDERGRRVLGYYGAIAEWFDVALVRELALANPEALVLLVGNDTIDAAGQLADLPNVRCTGEVPYAELPYWLHGFDVALLPFRVVPLTQATNPVKVYEYLAGGKPVVAVDLPEMAQFGGLVRTAGDAAGFVRAVSAALAGDGEPADAVARRQAFAASQTWSHRADEIDQAIAGIVEPLVSVVVLTYNNLALTQACLSSIEKHSDYPSLEVIVVDNASSDGSPEWLRRWAAEASPAGHQRRLLLNDENLGFAAGNNVGLAAARGEVLVMLNNDTCVTPGWVRTLCAHLRRDPGLGLVGPVTNNIGNEARINIDYSDMDEMVVRAGAYTRAHPGRNFPIRTAAFFCVAMPRSTYERVGGLDEAFGVGFFEDDDYCRRVADLGLGVACADDVFVHHYLSASFDKLAAERKRELFERNKAIYERKWGPWAPHVYRDGVH